MDIKEFVSKTISQISEGIFEAQKKSENIRISPFIHAKGDNSPKGKYFTTSNSSIA